MRAFYLTICLTGTCLFVSAHGNLITGTVSDAEYGTRLVGAYLILSHNNQVAMTDDLGNFRFDGLADGTYTLKCTFIGYGSETITVTVSGDETRTIEIRLSQSSLNLEEVIVTNPVSPQETMQTISQIDIALRPLKSSQDVLRMIPGLVTAQHAGGGKAEQIFLRGFDIDHGTDIALTVDDMPVNMVSHAHGQGYADLHFVIPEVIDRVDFNKGTYYAQTGDFNTAGFANFQTRNSLDKSSVKLEAGRFDMYRAIGLFNILDNTVRNQNAYMAAEYLFTNGPFISPQNFNRVNLFGKFSGKISDNKFFSASVSTFRSEWDASGQIPERAITRNLISRFGSLDDTEGGFTGRTNANFSLHTFNEDGSSFKSQFYVSDYLFELYSNFTFFLNDRVNGDAIKQKEHRSIYGYKGSFTKDFSVGNRLLQSTFGVGIRYDDVSDNELSHVRTRFTFIDPIAFGDIDEINASAYADFTYNLSQNLVVNGGARVDGFSFQYVDKLSGNYKRMAESSSVFSPKLSLFYNANSNFQIYLKSGYGFHSNDARVVVAQRGSQILPKAFGADLGFFAKPARNLLVNFSLWQLNLEQELVYVGDESVVEPSGETRRYGVDLSLRYQALPWLYADFDSNYAYGRSVNDPEGENYIPLAPRFTSIAGLTASLSNGLNASLRYRYVGNRPANADNSVVAKGYFLLDAALTYRRSAFELSISAANLANVEWNEAQFDTETFIPGDTESVSELTFTPGDPLFIKTGIHFFF